MIKLHLHSLCGITSQLMVYKIILGERPPLSDSPQDIASDKLVDDLKKWLEIASTNADDLESAAIKNRIATLRKRLSKERLRNIDISSEMRVLSETFDDSLKDQFVYRYPTERGRILFKWKDDWSVVLTRFPAADYDIFAGVDLWALGHATASVFQFMRVLEHGLRALAQDVGKTFDVQNWQNIIDEIEAEIRKLSKSLPRGSAKNERLQFLSEAAKEFVYFKDGWRNYVSHGKRNYDDSEALRVMEHVRAFMTTVSSQMREKQA